MTLQSQIFKTTQKALTYVNVGILFVQLVKARHRKRTKGQNYFIFGKNQSKVNENCQDCNKHRETSKDALTLLLSPN